MNILFVGSGKGSWQIRGVQMAAALGARATTQPTAADWSWADVVILVKHAIRQHGNAAAWSGARVIWDVLDFWEQPDENTLSVSEMVTKVQKIREHYRVAHLIGATQTMAHEIGGTYLPHHARPGLKARPVRTEMTTVAYEGTRKYLGPWLHDLQAVCSDLHLSFDYRPADLSQADVVVSFRGGPWDGPICRQWKSGVKYVNAMACGRPVITQSHAAFREMDVSGLVIRDPSELVEAIKVYQDYDVRQNVWSACSKMAPHYTLTRIAQRYQALIADVMDRAA